MSIRKIFSRIQSGFNTNTLTRAQAKVEKYFKINDYDTFGDSFNKMYSAKETIANYAKSKGVRVDIYAAEKVSGNEYEYTPVSSGKDSLADKIRVIVTNLSNGNSREKLVSARTDEIFPKYGEKRPMIIPIAGENIERAITPAWKTEDNFLRNLYRNIEALTNAVVKKSAKHD